MVDAALRRLPPIIDGAWHKTLPPAVRFAFYGDAVARAAVFPAWGVQLSEHACRANVQAARASLWVGPDEYLLLDLAAAAPDPTAVAADAAAVAASLEQAMGDLPHALVDISHRQFALEIRGPHALTILCGACPLDLDLSEFPVGMCTRTVFAKANIVLWRRAEDVFHVEVGRSFAGYVGGLLAELGAEFPAA